jgi:hypothetical protein
VRGCKHHFSIHRLFCAGLIEMTMTIFTSPLELSSHHLASVLSLASDSESPASKTSVGQLSFPARHYLGLYVESPSLELVNPVYVVPPQLHKLRLGRTIPSSL